ncbi:unnamed protein product [Diabrotica balteata]|uniref:Neuroendocrine protein 7B2 n=1 Tax=Diabrotica balteata TaxID=107213 RepID=A0A9N9T7Q8_DIABA|nr:unnamed protein product [Diabrotica balteata]
MKITILMCCLTGAMCYLPPAKENLLSGLFLRDLVNRINGKGISEGDGVSYLDFTDGMPLDGRSLSGTLEEEQMFPMDYEAMGEINMHPSIRDQEYLQHSTLWGKQILQRKLFFIMDFIPIRAACFMGRKMLAITPVYPNISDISDLSDLEENHLQHENIFQNSDDKAGPNNMVIQKIDEDREADEEVAIEEDEYLNGDRDENSILQHNGFKNKNVHKGESTLPAYCSPPNPCPIGYTEYSVKDFDKVSIMVLKFEKVNATKTIVSLIQEKETQLKNMK